MAKKQVHEYECDRCSKIWHVEDEQPMTSLSATLEVPGEPGKEVILEVLCKRCAKVVQDAFRLLLRQPKDEKAEDPTAPKA